MSQDPDLRERLAELREKADAFEAEVADLGEREGAFRLAELRLLDGRLYRRREPLIEIKRLQGYSGDVLDREKRRIGTAGDEELLEMYDELLAFVRERIEHEVADGTTRVERK